MEIVYANQPFPDKVTKSIFLMGPTLRSDGFVTVAYENWRDVALEILESKGYNGVVFVPEPADNKFAREYDNQVDWEDEGLNRADAILCWIPRNLATLPGFTTNTEFGEWFKSGKLIFGAPEEAPKTRYQIYKCNKEGVPVHTTLENTIQATLDYLGDGIYRENGECTVPLNIWQTSLFNDWYSDLQSTGGRLKRAKAFGSYKVDGSNDSMLSWSMKVEYFPDSKNEREVESIFLSRINGFDQVILGSLFAYLT